MMIATVAVGAALTWNSLCRSCGPGVDPRTTQAIIKVESGGNPYVINDNTGKRSYKLRSKEEAGWYAYYLLRQGRSIDMGLMQINSIHLEGMKINYYDLFDPCYNISIGTRVLSDFYRSTYRPGDSPDQNLLKALSAYNTGNAYAGAGYVNKILAAAGSSTRVPVRVKTAKKTHHQQGRGPAVFVADNTPIPNQNNYKKRQSNLFNLNQH